MNVVSSFLISILAKYKHTCLIVEYMSFLFNLFI